MLKDGILTVPGMAVGSITIKLVPSPPPTTTPTPPENIIFSGANQANIVAEELSAITSINFSTSFTGGTISSYELMGVWPTGAVISGAGVLSGTWNDVDAVYTDLQVRAIGSNNNAETNVFTVTLTAAGTGTATAAITPSITSGPAPLAVHFDAIATTDSSVTDPFKDLTYTFGFDDSSAGTWTHSGLSKNEQVGGPLAAHVYDTPGTYTAQVTAGGDTATVVITVTDPDVVFATTNTVCISTNTDTTGAPAGASLLTNQTSWPTFEDGKRYMLRAGQDFSSFGGMNTGQLHNAQITSFGSGAKPIVGRIDVQSSSGGYPDTGNWVSDVVVQGLNAAGIYNSISAENILIYQNDINGTGTGIDIAGSVLWYRQQNTYPLSLTMTKNYFVVENTSNASGGWFTGEGQMVWMGNTIGNTAQWNIRLWQFYKTFIAHNFLTGDSDAGGKSNIKIHSSGTDVSVPDTVYGTTHLPRSSYLVAANDTYNTNVSTGIYAAITIEPQNNQEAEGIEQVIVENCEAVGPIWSFVFGGRYMTGRNITLTSGALAGDTGHNMGAIPSWDGPYYT